MEKFNCIIVEDEPLASEILQDYISQIPFLECKTICRDAIYAMQVLQEERIDVLFLDIHLPKIKGLDFIKMLKHPPQVIITTAYREYALDGYELNVVDYLLKPISFNRFVSAVNKLKNETYKEMISATDISKPIEQSYLLLSINKKWIKIYENDILFIESRREYLNIVTTKHKYLTKKTISEMELQLHKKGFLRIHRSFLVAINKISVFTATSIEIGDIKLPVGRSYRNMVQSLLSDLKSSQNLPKNKIIK